MAPFRRALRSGKSPGLGHTITLIITAPSYWWISTVLALRQSVLCAEKVNGPRGGRLAKPVHPRTNMKHDRIGCLKNVV